MMKSTLVIIGCSKKKKEYKTEAKNMYQGKLFKLSKKYAEINGYEYQIISAKYGLLNPSDVIEVYDKQIKNSSDVKTVQKMVMPKLDLKKFGRIIVLAGSKYREVLKSVWDERFTYVKSKGYGDLCRKIQFMMSNKEGLNNDLCFT